MASGSIKGWATSGSIVRYDGVSPVPFDGANASVDF
jgi:hypothetical protein